MKIVENKEYINSIWHVSFFMYYCWATMYSHHTWLHILFLLFVESKIKMFTIIERTRTHFIMLNGKLLYNRDASVCFSDNLQLLKMVPTDVSKEYDINSISSESFLAFKQTRLITIHTVRTSRQRLCNQRVGCFLGLNLHNTLGVLTLQFNGQ